MLPPRSLACGARHAACVLARQPPDHAWTRVGLRCQAEMRLRRLFAVGSALGLLAHNAFETRAGVGLVFEPFIGRRGAYALWSAYFPLMLAAAVRDDEEARRLSAFSAGIGVAGVAVHFKAWPWSRRRGIPMLDEAEGLSAEQLPAYNAVLWFWLLCSALSLPAANRPGARCFAAAGLLNFPILLASAKHHFRWAREQAELEPERWSAALRE
jgi:hypothetical protein